MSSQRVGVGRETGYCVICIIILNIVHDRCSLLFFGAVLQVYFHHRGEEGTPPPPTATSTRLANARAARPAWCAHRAGRGGGGSAASGGLIRRPRALRTTRSTRRSSQRRPAPPLSARTGLPSERARRPLPALGRAVRARPALTLPPSSLLSPRRRMSIGISTSSSSTPVLLAADASSAPIYIWPQRLRYRCRRRGASVG